MDDFPFALEGLFVNVKHQSAQDAECGQFLRTSSDIGYRFGADRMQRPQSRGEKCGPIPPRQPQRQQVDQERVRRMRHQVEPVISDRPIGVAQHDIVHQI